eukprot:CAMPEP_0203748264 /NCGR_PEP_ID=MMETSP0098-20131031/3197_1 /ASSEMBLY_ACC=CAM_ASM_000208 /TAXON_ID=96639 /ORGANISM=" , Strain NY0313808BC1" /LENGTH=633 /DNA_ID=CAMNT_0050636957 /DNA_START=212 /DNA_END=2110 /DNA_ORIENTATION=-
MESDDSSCLEAWHAIDLVNVQLALDEQAGQVADFRESSINGRKELAVRTKEFKKREDVRKAPDSSVLKTELPKLLRGYQLEVDSLTQRAKFAENCFLSMYRLIREAPDPSKALAKYSSVSFHAQAAKVELENRLVEKENEIAKLKDKLDKAKVFESSVGKDADDETKEKEKMAKEQEREMRERYEQNIAEKYQEELETCRTNLETEISNMAVQLELAQSEIETQNEVVQSLQASLSNFERKPKSISQVEQASRFEEENRSLLADLQEARRKEVELLGKISVYEAQHSTMVAQHQQHAAEMNSMLVEKTNQLADARQQLSSCASKEEYNKLRNQLLVIQRELYNVEDDDGNKNTNMNGEEELDGLDTWFLTTTKQLKQELILSKRTIEEQKTLIEKVKQAEERLGDALKDQTALVAKLESEMEAGMVGRPRTETTLPNVSAPAAQSSGEFQETDHTITDQQQALNSMLQAVCAQRDRLRAQLQAKEEEMDAKSKAKNETEQALRKLKEDNVQLYQRIRFLQNYKASERSTLIADGSVPTETTDLESGQAVVLSSQGRAKVGGLGRGVEHKYKTIYESDMNPLEAFKQKESERLQKNVPRIERLALQTFNAFLTRSRGRVFLVIYPAVLHILLIW